MPLTLISESWWSLFLILILNRPPCFANVLVMPLWILCLRRDLYSVLDAIYSAISQRKQHRHRNCAFSCCFVLNAVLNICNSTGVSKRDLLLCDILLFHYYYLLFLFLFLRNFNDCYRFKGVHLCSPVAFAFSHSEQYCLLNIDLLHNSENIQLQVL